MISLPTFFIVVDVDLCHIVADLDFDIDSSSGRADRRGILVDTPSASPMAHRLRAFPRFTFHADVHPQELSSSLPSLPCSAFGALLLSSPHHPPGRLSATPWNRPAAPRRPAGARPQRGPRVNLLNWRANWRLSSRGRFWLRGWGNQIESPPGYSVPPSIEMDAASRCILAPRQVATELAVEGACGPHVVVEGAASTDIGLGCVTSRRQDRLQDFETTCKTSGRPAMLKSICKSSRQPSPTYLKTDLALCLLRQDGWSSSGMVVGHQ
ncbi:hypothetical protein EV715DRAFT_290838 [Schizophyllum commune]